MKLTRELLTIEDMQRLMKIIGKEELLRARRESQRNMTKETLEVKWMLLGGAVTITVEFDATAK